MAGVARGLDQYRDQKGQEGKQVELQIGGKTGFNSHNDHDENISAAMSGGLSAHSADSLFLINVMGVVRRQRQ